MRVIRYLFIVVVGVLVFPMANSYAAVPLMINYQGSVKDTGGSPFSGDGYFKFAIVDSTAATTYWSNDGTSAAGSEPTASVIIPVSNGLFAVKLGEAVLMDTLPASVFDIDSLYLRVWFSADDTTYELLDPDMQIVSTGFSIKSGNADNALDLNCTGCVAATELANSPGGEFASGVGNTSLTSTDAVITSVTMNAPSSGVAIVYASGYFLYSSAGYGICSISPNTSVSTSGSYVAASGDPANNVTYNPFGSTAGFTVSAAGSVTYYMVCRLGTTAATISVIWPKMTAIFVPIRY